MLAPQPPRRSDIPTPGSYLLRLVRGGPWVGAVILHREGEGWFVMIDGDWKGASPDPWPADDLGFLGMMESVHFYGRPSTDDEVKFRIGVKRWSEIYHPQHAAANPRRKINVDTAVPI